MHPESPFNSVPYRFLFLAQITSLAGTGLTTVALALLAVELAGANAGLVLGIALSLKMVVYVLGAPIMGVVASRFQRKRWLVALDVARAGVVACLPFVDEVWQLYVLVVLVNLFAASFTPVFQATIPSILDHERRYQRALSYAQVAYSTEQIASPIVAAALLAFMSFDVLFTLNAITFLASAALVVAAGLPSMKRAREPISVDHIWFGISAYLRTPRLRATFAMYFAVAAASAMVIVNSVVYVVGELGLSSSHLGFTLAASGAGSIIGATLTPALLSRFRHRTIMLSGTALLTGGLLAGTTLPSWSGLLIVWFTLGLGLGLTQTPVGSLVRMSCHQRHSEAFFAANFSLSHFCWFFAYLAAGWLGSHAGLAFAFGAAAAIAMFALIAFTSIFPNPDPLVLAHSHPAMAHQHRAGHDEAHAPASDGTSHFHPELEHAHYFVIDEHHPTWATRSGSR